MKKSYTRISVDFQPMNLDATVTASCVTKLTVATNSEGKNLTNFPTESDLYCAAEDGTGGFVNYCYTKVEGSGALEMLIQHSGLFTS